MKLFVYLFIVFFLVSCSDRVAMDYYEEIEESQSISYKIKVPKRFQMRESNFIEVKNLKTEFDTLTNAYGVFYAFLEDEEINDNVFTFNSNTKNVIFESDLSNQKYFIPNDLLENKRGNLILTVVLLKIYLKDDNQLQNTDDNAKLDISYLESRSFFNVFLE